MCVFVSSCRAFLPANRECPVRAGALEAEMQAKQKEREEQKEEEEGGEREEEDEVRDGCHVHAFFMQLHSFNS